MTQTFSYHVLKNDPQLNDHEPQHYGNLGMSEGICPRCRMVVLVSEKKEYVRQENGYYTVQHKECSDGAKGRDRD